jgi:hypothetical protein
MLVSLLLFFTLDSYLWDMEKLWMNEFVTPTIWENFMTNQLKQWADGILLVMQLDLTRFLLTHAIAIQATVILAVDVGFLTVPGVVYNNYSGNSPPPSKPVVYTTPILVCIALSIEACGASIVIGMLLVRHNNTKMKEPPTGAVSE